MEVQVTIVISWWSIFGISTRVERGSGIIVYIEIHMIANCDFPQCLNIFIHYNDISAIMNSTLVDPNFKVTDFYNGCLGGLFLLIGQIFI